MIDRRTAMPTIVTRLLLFLSSYFPLTGIFFFLLFKEHPKIAIGIMTVGAIGLGGMAVFLRAVQHLGGVKIKIVELQRRDGEAMSYIVTYVIPFIAIPYSGVEQGISLFIFFVVLAILYVNSNMVHINPMLNLG